MGGLVPWAGDTLLALELRLTWITSTGRVARIRMMSVLTGYASPRRVELRPLDGGIVLAWARDVVHMGEPSDSVVLAFSEFGSDRVAPIAVMPDTVWTSASQFVGPLNAYGARPLFAVSPLGLGSGHW